MIIFRVFLSPIWFARAVSDPVVRERKFLRNETPWFGCLLSARNRR